MSQDNTILMKGVQIIFRNFEGKEGQYNKAGTRNFGVLLPPDVAEQMIADGWNVKMLQPREDDVAEDPDAQPKPWLPVEAAFDKGRPPKIVMITSRGRNPLSEETVEQLDWADILNVDLIVRPYTWEVNGNTGVKAYLKTMFVTVEEDELEKEYAEMENQQ